MFGYVLVCYCVIVPVKNRHPGINEASIPSAPHNRKISRKIHNFNIFHTQIPGKQKLIYIKAFRNTNCPGRR